MNIQIPQKFYFGEKSQVIVYYPMLRNENLELIRSNLLQICKKVECLSPLQVLDKTRKTWTIFFKLKALADTFWYRANT